MSNEAKVAEIDGVINELRGSIKEWEELRTFDDGDQDYVDDEEVALRQAVDLLIEYQEILQ